MALIVIWFINWAGLMLYLGASKSVESFLTFLIIFAIAMYLCGALFVYVRSVHERRQERKRQTLIEQQHQLQQRQQQQQLPDTGAGGDVRIVPVYQTAEDEDHHDTVARLVTSFENSERDLRKHHAKQQKRQSINVQRRVAARRKVRQTKALTKASVFAGIDSAATEEVLAVMDYERYEKGAVICAEGDAADRFFVIVAGKCRVTQRVAHSSSSPTPRDGVDADESMHVGDLRPLDVMGENALIVDGGDGQRRIRSATVTAASGVVQTLELQHTEFELLVESGIIGQEVLERMQAVQRERRDICKALQQSQALQRTELFKDLSAEALVTVIDEMGFRRFDAGVDLVKQGEAASELMVIMDGVAAVYQNGRHVRDFGRLDIIGEIAMMPGDHVRGATVTATGGKVSVLVLPKDRFERLKGSGVLLGGKAQSVYQRALHKSQQYLDEDALRRIEGGAVVGAPPNPPPAPPPR